MKPAWEIALVLLTFSAASGRASAQVAGTKWKGLLGNQVLSQVIKDDGDRLRLKGMTVKTTASGVATDLHLCNDGSFVHIRKVFSSGENLQIGHLTARTGPGSILIKVTGRWKIVSANAVSAHVVLNPSTNADHLEDEDRDLQISFDGANTVVNEARWFRMKSPACR